ncbi:MAG TPA: ferrous iron transport protein B [Anaerolineales bacterium]|nr:ferrous iron transport protein B [Anaerolineales bacterium]
MRVALIGAPNCGKSTLFNQVAGYKAATGNFSGTTIAYTESRVRVGGELIELVDLPGTYTLEGGSPAEEQTAQYLNSRDVDVIINVADATRLAAALELSLELLPLKKPLILALNMMDEAVHEGLKVDGEGLSQELGIIVLPLVASKGRGVKKLFLKSLELGREERRKVACLKECRDDVSNAEGWKEDAANLDSFERHIQARELVEKYVSQGERYLTLRDKLDDVLLHPVWGYGILFFVLFLFFQVVYGVGKLSEPPLLAMFNVLTKVALDPLDSGSLFVDIVLGVMQGIAAGVAIVLPYLLPFLFGLGILEDVGYLPRVAFLMDSFMHRIGLHGKAIVPFILGYGCNVPAVMSTRTLEEPRDRYLASALATLVPCAARLAVVFGLVAFYLGPLMAFSLYLFNLLIIAVTGRILTRMMPEDTPGLILEMPPYRVPTIKNVLNKSWFRMREFVVEAWPLLIAGSAVLAVLNHLDLSFFINGLVRPFTWAMGLPHEVGLPLIFGILRKELSLVMLSQALGTVDFESALTSTQMLVYATFVMFYLPCLATLAVLKRELGLRAMLVISALTVVVALFAALIVREIMLIA